MVEALISRLLVFLTRLRRDSLMRRVYHWIETSLLTAVPLIGKWTMNAPSPVAEPEHYRYRVLMGALSRLSLIQTVRMWSIPAEVQRLEQITQAWAGPSTRMGQLAQSDAGVQDTIAISEVPQALHTRLQDIASDQLFQASYSGLPTAFAVVEIDKLVAPQRDVNLDYVDEIRARIPGSTVEQLLEFCVGPRPNAPEWKALQTAPNHVIFTSKSLDLRFLGGYRKPLLDSDISVAHGGGQPVEAIVLLVGYGSAPVNVYRVGNRAILWNGFHRVIAMRMEGITHIPVVLQTVAQPDIEFPNDYLGLPRSYLVGDPRPVLIKDFFDAQMIIELRMTPRRKTVKLMWGQEDSIIPV
jgi:hypothetical protein